MKANIGKRRCEWCKAWFVPSTGGRPAKYCSASCRQRAYEARTRARPDTAPGTRRRSGALRTAALVARPSEGQVFSPADAKAIFQTIGAKPREETAFSDVAEKLDYIAQGCVSTFHRETAPTAGKLQNGFRSIERDVMKVLAHFGLSDPLDHLSSNNTINALNRLLRGIPANDGREVYLRNTMAREVGAPSEISQWRALHGSVRGMQFLAHTVRLAADVAEKNKSAPRKEPVAEINLVAASHDLYTDVTGDPNWHTIDPESGTSVGPFVDFVGAVAAHIVPAAPAALAKNLKALSESPRRIGKRIRKVRRLLKDANR